MKIRRCLCLLILLTLGVVRPQPQNPSPTVVRDAPSLQQAQIPIQDAPSLQQAQIPIQDAPSPARARLFLKILARLLHEEDAQFGHSKFDETQPEFPLSVETVDQIIATRPDVSLENFDLLPASYIKWTEEFIDTSQYLSPDTRSRFDSYIALRPILADLSKLWQERNVPEADRCRRINNFPQTLKDTLTIDEANIHKYLSPEYDRRRLLHWTKVFIGDIIRYQITSRFCNLNPSIVDWTTIRDALKRAEGRLFDQWHSEQLETDVRLLIADAYRFPPNSIREDQDIKKILDFKYYWNVFKVEIHATSKQCPAADPQTHTREGVQITEPRILCITKSKDSQVGAQIIVRWTRNPTTSGPKTDKMVEDLNIKLTLFLRGVMTQKTKIFNITEFIGEKFLPINIDAMGNIVNPIKKKLGRLHNHLRVNLSHFDALSPDLQEKGNEPTMERFLNEREKIFNLSRFFDVTTHRQPRDKVLNFEQMCHRLGDLPRIIKETLLADPDPHKRLAPTYDLLKLRGWMKVIIGDLARYQLVGSICQRSLAYDQWEDIAIKLQEMQNRLMESWFQDEEGLTKDVKDNIVVDNSKAMATNYRLMGLLEEKYFWLTFRVHVYTQRTDLDGVRKVLCSSDGSTQDTPPKLTCIEHDEAVVLVRWKPLIEADTPKKMAISRKDNAGKDANKPAKREHKEVSDDWEKAGQISAFIGPATALGELENYIGKEKESPIMKLAELKKSSSSLAIGTANVALATQGQAEAIKTISTQTIKRVSTVAKTFKKVLNIVANIGKYLGPLASSICSIVSAFTEAGSTEIIEEVRKGFDEMHQRFDQLGEKIDVIRDEIKDSIVVNTAFYALYTAYDGNVNKKLVLLRAAAAKFNSLPNNGEAHKELRALCEHAVYRPQNLLSWMHDHLTGSRAVSFATAILGWARQNRADLHRVLISFAYDASELGLFITTRCLPVQGNSTTSPYDVALSNAYDASVAQWQLYEIRETLARIDDAHLYGWQHEMETKIKNVVTDAGPTQRTSQAISANILDEIRSSYPWNVFQVMVVAEEEAEKTKSKSVFNPDYMRFKVYETDAKTSTKWLVGVHWSLGEEDVAPYPEENPQGSCSSWDDSLKQFSQRVAPGVIRNGVVIVKDWTRTEWLCKKWQSCDRYLGSLDCWVWQDGGHELCRPIDSAPTKSQEKLSAISSSNWPDTNFELAKYDMRCDQGLDSWGRNLPHSVWYVPYTYEDGQRAAYRCLPDEDRCPHFDHEKTRINMVYYLVNTGLGY